MFLGTSVACARCHDHKFDPFTQKDFYSLAAFFAERYTDLLAVATLQFEAPDNERYPCLALATAAWQTGGTAPTLLNAANEVAVQAFLDERIAFTAIHAVIRHVMEQCSVHAADTLEMIIADDAVARTTACECIESGRAVTA